MKTILEWYFEILTFDQKSILLLFATEYRLSCNNIVRNNFYAKHKWLQRHRSKVKKKKPLVWKFEI